MAALWARFDDFPAFAGLSFLYFAAASYAEAARRLGRPELAGSFLSGDHPRFGPALAECCALALSGADRSVLDRKVRDAIAPLDVIGLSDVRRRNWYPVLADDLLDACDKLGATRTQVREMLARIMPAPAPPPAPAAGRASGPVLSAASRSPA